MDITNDEIQFVLYGTEKYRNTKLNIGITVEDILKRIAKNNRINKLTVTTVDDCHVLDYYKNKLNYTQRETNSKIHLLDKSI